MRPGTQRYSRADALGVTQLHAPVQCSDLAIAGRLVKHRIALHGLRKRLRVGLLLDLKAVEAGAQHEYELVTQHLTGGAHFAAIAIALAQQSGLAVGTAVPEAWKQQCDLGQLAEIR